MALSPSYLQMHDGFALFCIPFALQHECFVQRGHQNSLEWIASHYILTIASGLRVLYLLSFNSYKTALYLFCIIFVRSF